MAKRFKLRICRAISTTLQSCRSKDPSTLPQDPVPSLFSNLHTHHVSSSFISFATRPPPPPPPPPQFKWQNEEKWHVVAQIHQQSPPRLKIHNSSDEDLTPPTLPPPPSSAEKNRRRRKKKKNKNIPSRLRLSTSSADSGWFTSDGGGGAVDEEETETLVSSDSSSNLPTKNKALSKSKRTKRAVVRPPLPPSAETEAPARLSVFKKLIPCTVDGKVKESFAIVKRSEDPYQDFKNSMMDMIVEKQIFEKKDLEQLLQCFLSLNSRHYHGIIVRAFSEIWEAIFSPAASQLSDHGC